MVMGCKKMGAKEIWAIDTNPNKADIGELLEAFESILILKPLKCTSKEVWSNPCGEPF